MEEKDLDNLPVQRISVSMRLNACSSKASDPFSFRRRHSILCCCLSECRPVLSKERMLTEIWEGSFVEENNLAQNISLLGKGARRKAERKVYRDRAQVRIPLCRRGPGRPSGSRDFEQTRARVYIEDAGGIHHISQDPASHTVLTRAVHPRHVMCRTAM